MDFLDQNTVNVTFYKVIHFHSRLVFFGVN